MLDIAAHEYGHALTQYTSDLVYAYEPGALNEAYSDIIGAAVEFWVQPDGTGSYPNATPGHDDWLAGEDAWQGFVVLPAAAASVWEPLAGAWESVDHGGATVLFTEVPYSGFVGIMQQGDRVLGVAEAPDQATMLARLEAFGG